ncbi:hypothetical protein [Rhizobium laguerreae]|uniref:hypothetical protein n=1 Tax=Rhizobium laguerreae TaxID=1076926 RepID=UPI001039AB2B|nr:hypothetical protein [Rhizobium laguerreae]TBY08159.1 hypothetical protein E0J21_14265 [Rhizobium laguerreae]
MSDVPEFSPGRAAAAEVTPSAPCLEFLASHGGPFYDLQKRLALLHDQGLRAGRRALIFAAIAWLVPLVLSSSNPVAYLGDPGTWAKFLIAVAAFILAEQQVEAGLRMKIRQFESVPLIGPDSFPAAAASVENSLRLRDSLMAEVCCLAFGVALSVVAYSGVSPAASWAAAQTPEGASVTLAGWWALVISLPLFGFLFLRGLWRHTVWALLLRDLAKLELRLVGTHPDGKGGLAFLGAYPNAYMLFVLGASSAVAAAIAKHLAHENISTTTFTSIVGGWLVIVLALFAFPLSAFSRPLAQLKERSLLSFGAEATRYQRMAERKALGTNVASPSTVEETSDSSVDTSKQFEATRKLSAMLINRSAVLPVAAAALLPFAVAGATKLPFKEVLSVLKKLLLL